MNTLMMTMMNTTENKPNYKQAEFCAHDLLKFLKVKEFPLNLIEISSVFSEMLRIIPYSKYMNDHNLSYDDIIGFFDSEDGVSVCHNGKYIIFYNDIIDNSERIRWTIAHELGHISLNHHKNEKTILTRNRLSKEEYIIYELEAHTFAREFLAPMSLVYYIYSCFGNSANISSIFGLSHEATQNILKKMFE